MKQHIPGIRQIIQHLKSHLTHEDNAGRLKKVAFYHGIMTHLKQQLSVSLAKAQVDEAKKIKGESTQLLSERTALLHYMNESIDQIACFEACLYQTLSAYNEHANACEVHSRIMSLLLINHFGINIDTRIECINLYDATNRMLNHQFVILGRKDESTLDDVASWGDDCLVIDSWGEWIAGIQSLPQNTAICCIREVGLTASRLDMRVSLDSRFGLNNLQRYKHNPDHLLHQIELISYNLLFSYVQNVVSSFMGKVKIPVSLMNVESAARSVHAFYPGSVDTARHTKQSEVDVPQLAPR